MNRIAQTLVLAVCSFAPAVGFAQSPAPAPAALPIPLSSNNFAHGQTWDGRVFFAHQDPLPGGASGGWVVSVFRPEALQADASGVPQFTANTFSPRAVLGLDGDPATGQAKLGALAIVPAPGFAQNPYRSTAAGLPMANGTHETYEVLIYTNNVLRLGRHRARVVVSAPRTAAAAVASTTLLGPWLGLTTGTGGELFGILPTATFDGRLLVWDGHPDNDRKLGFLVYSWNATPGALTGWSEPRSITDMFPVDRATLVAGVRFDERYPIAAQRLRMPSGAPFGQGALYPGAYPWITHDGTEIVAPATLGSDRVQHTGLSIIGRFTGYTLRHIDGPLNPDRRVTIRNHFTSPGTVPTFWTPYRDVRDVPIPYTAGRPVFPLISTQLAVYSEVSCEDQDGDSVLSLHMNELLNRRFEVGILGPGFGIDAQRTPDTSGRFNTGTLQDGAGFPQELLGVDTTVGVIGQGVLFPASGSVLVRHTPSLAEPRAAITVQLWVRRLAAVSTPLLLVHKPGAYALHLDAQGRAVGTVVAGGQILSSTPTAAAPVDAWTHVAFSYEGRSGTLRTYVNGQQVGTANGAAGEVNPSTADLLIGPAGQASGGPPLLILDEVAVSRVVRTDDELAAAGLHRPAPEDFAHIPQALLPLGLDSEETKLPRTNLPTQGAIELGYNLFFDARLSGDGTVSCASCHEPDRAFTDGRRRGIGIGGQVLDFNSPTAINRVFGTQQFFDGRAASLEEQATAPIENPKEMGSSIPDAVAFLQSVPAYAQRFQAVYGEGPSKETIAKALASFMRAILSGDSDVDRFQAGQVAALDASAQRGRLLFQGRARCITCHDSSNFSDESFHNTGLKLLPGPGRQGVTGRVKDRGAFKTPTLRDISLTGPYFHDGSAASLAEVIEIYDRGGNTRLGRDPEIRPLELSTQDKLDLEAFLRGLQGRSVNILPPAALPGQ